MNNKGTAMSANGANVKWLGINQQLLLEELREKHAWHHTMGWGWGSSSATRTLLDKLVQRGLVRVINDVYFPVEEDRYGQEKAA